MSIIPYLLFESTANVNKSVCYSSNMQFLFQSKSSCCGSKYQTKLTSTQYTIDSTNVSKSIIQALDRFHTNYRVEPQGIIVTQIELSSMQQNIPTEFSLASNVLMFRGYPVTISGE